MGTHTTAANDTNFDRLVTTTEGPVLIDFWAEWCGPCRLQAPVLEKFAAANPDVTVLKVDVDNAPQVAQRYGIRSIPTLAVFIDGKPVLGTAGLTKEAGLRQLVDEAKKQAS